MLYLVSYDLNRPIQNYPQLDKVLKTLGGKRILETVWLVPSNFGPVDFHNSIKTPGGLDKNDRLFTGELHNSAAWDNLLIDDTTVRQMFSTNARP